MRPWLPLLLVLGAFAQPLFAQGPSAATGNGTIAVVWRTSSDTIAGALLSQSGQLLAQLNLGVGSTTPAIAFDGVRYLAVWPNGALTGRFFDENGNASDAFTLSPDVATDVPPAISWNGADFIVVYLRAARDLYWVEARNAQGTLERAAFINTGVSPLLITPSVSVASSGLTTLVAVAWSRSDTMRGNLDTVLYDSTLQALAAARLDSGSIALYGAAGGDHVPQTPDVAASPAGFLVTWLSSSGRPVPMSIRASRVALDGTAIDATPLTIETSPVSETETNPRVTWDGTKFFETWTRGSGGPDAGTWASAITTSGQVSAPTQIVRDPRLADVTGISPGRDAIVWTNDTRLDLALVGVASERRRAASH